MTLREALDLLELNERTLEQSMLESSLQNRLEHTELRHVLRVFEAYRKVNAFLNPSFNTQGDARMTIIDESVPGGPMLEVARASYPAVTASSVVVVKERDTFSDTLIETWAASDAERLPPKSTLPLEVSAPRAAGVNLFVMLGLIAAAFSVGMVVLGPTMSLIFKRPAISASRPAPSRPAPSRPAPSASRKPPVVTAPPVAPAVTPVAPVVTAPVVTAPPVAPVVMPPPAVTRPAPPVAVTVEPIAPAAPIKPTMSVKPAASAKPVTPAITKPAVRPTVSAKPPVARVKPRVTPRPRVATPRVAVQPRATIQPRVASRRTTLIPRASSRPVSVVAPSRRAVNQRQFAQWDSAGVVLRYRSWSLVPDAVRGLSANAFRAAIFVARDPSSLPDIPR